MRTVQDEEQGMAVVLRAEEEGLVGVAEGLADAGVGFAPPEQNALPSTSCVAVDE